MEQPKIAIIGAGPSGITAAKNFLKAGLTRITVFEKGDQVGGNWVFREDTSHSSVYETTHIISSKRLSQFEDFPMPDHYPDYPSHHQLKLYFQSYARHFEVEPLVHFHTEVCHVSRREDGDWQVVHRHKDEAEHTTVFQVLVVCNGHHWCPKLPEYPGTFHGEILHSHAYKKAEPFRDKRVLIVGGGNSACDVAVETARVSRRTVLSWRRGYYIIPKFIFGQPSDVVGARFHWLPPRVRQVLFKITLRMAQGENSCYGLQKPQCKPLEMHPTVNSELLYFIRHGKVHPKMGIKCFDGHTVHFQDGASEDFETVIFATGYQTVFPFFDPAFLNFSESTQIPLYRKMMHPDYTNLYVIGLFQPQGCIWPLADYQARLAALEVTGKWQRPTKLGALIEKELANPHFNFEEATRHAAEVDYFTFRKELLQEIKRAQF